MSTREESRLPSSMDPSTYRKIGLDELVTYALHSLDKRGVDATFENIVAEAFGLFPERFALRGFPQWPDSSVVNKSWLRCRSDKHYIEGSTKQGFRLTAKGVEVAARMARLFEAGAHMPQRSRGELSETRTREGTFVRALEQSEAFRRYQGTGTLDHMLDYDFCEMLMCTTESSPSVLQANLEQFRHACQLYARDELVRFLGSCEQRFEHLLGKPGSGRYRGGMMRRRLSREGS